MALPYLLVGVSLLFLACPIEFKNLRSLVILFFSMAVEEQAVTASPQAPESASSREAQFCTYFEERVQQELGTTH